MVKTPFTTIVLLILLEVFEFWFVCWMFALVIETKLDDELANLVDGDWRTMCGIEFVIVDDEEVDEEEGNEDGDDE